MNKKNGISIVVIGLMFSILSASFLHAGKIILTYEDTSCRYITYSKEVLEIYPEVIQDSGLLKNKKSRKRYHFYCR